jgi:hypothetical protein
LPRKAEQRRNPGVLRGQNPRRNPSESVALCSRQLHIPTISPDSIATPINAGIELVVINTGAGQDPAANKSRKHPRSTDPGAVFVGDGRLTAGWIIERNASHFAFNFRGQLVGEFESRAEAVRALPYADLVGGCA